MNAPERITELRGLYPHMGIDDYHAGPGISNSGLNDFARSPAHYFALHLDPRRPPARERAGQLEGTLAHCAVLEPDEFDKRYVVVPEDAPNRPSVAQWRAKNPSAESKAAMAWWTDFNARTGGAKVITSAQRDVAMAQARSIRSNPDVAALLGKGMTEVSAFWHDEETGLLCRCRPDFVSTVSDDGVVLLDVKTYSDASPSEFARQVARKGYHRQDAFYTDGYAQAAHVNVLGFVFVAVETEWPYASSAVMLDDEGRERGRSANRELLDRFAGCWTTGVWPGYSTSIEPIALPAWA